MRCWGELKSLRGQSVGEVSAGLQLVEKLATPLSTCIFGLYFMQHQTFVFRFSLCLLHPGGVLPYMAYMGNAMCHWTGYGFYPLS